jgi:hypothetical protein
MIDISKININKSSISVSSIKNNVSKSFKSASYTTTQQIFSFDCSKCKIFVDYIYFATCCPPLYIGGQHTVCESSNQRFFLIYPFFIFITLKTAPSKYLFLSKSVRVNKKIHQSTYMLCLVLSKILFVSHSTNLAELIRNTTEYES